jgi:putative transposase
VQATYRVSQRRASRLLVLDRMTLRYKSTKDPQTALRLRLRELAATHVRYGYRRLTVLLRREGWVVNAKRIYRFYREAGLLVRSKTRRRFARNDRVPRPMAVRTDQCWSMDFVAVRFTDGRMVRILTVVDHFSRECISLTADRRLTGRKVAEALDIALAERQRKPDSITVDNGSEFTSKAMGDWAAEQKIRLDFIRPGKPVENAFIESFNGRLRDECLNLDRFGTLAELREKLEQFRDHYNHQRPHSALDDYAPAEFARQYRAASESCFALDADSTASEPVCPGPSVNGLAAALDKPVQMRKSDKYEGEAGPGKPSRTRNSLLRLWKKFQARQSGSGKY